MADLDRPTLKVFPPHNGRADYTYNPATDSLVPTRGVSTLPLGPPVEKVPVNGIHNEVLFVTDEVADLPDLGEDWDWFTQPTVIDTVYPHGSSPSAVRAQAIRDNLRSNVEETRMGTVLGPVVPPVQPGWYSEVKDSGVRQEFETGSVRDTNIGKGRFDLMSPIALLRIARHYENGAVKYGDRNWELGQPLHRYLDSAMRHIVAYLGGDRSEDHLSAATWNLMAYIHTEQRIRDGKLPKALDDMGVTSERPE